MGWNGMEWNRNLCQEDPAPSRKQGVNWGHNQEEEHNKLYYNLVLVIVILQFTD